MTWEEVNLLYELKTPVHIGYLPSKSSVIGPTRYYIPGKNFWGAHTKVLTEKLFNNPIPKNYHDVGEWFKNNVRFTYFYIYDENYDGQPLLAPKYSDEGLEYGNMPLSEFQNRFTGSFISTEINSDTGTAEDESLHEIEFIRSKYSSESGIKNTRIFGKMFIKKEFSTDEIEGADLRIEVDKNGITADGEDPFRVIFIGGELNYGFGKIEKLDATPDIKYDKLGFKFYLNSNEKVCIKPVDKNPILSHLRYSEKYQFSGDVELISGRGYKKEEKEIHKNPGRDIAQPEPYFTPGTVVDNLEKVEVDPIGVWNSL